MTATAARRALFLAMVATLPLHTVSLDVWIAWKPFLVVLVVLAVWDGSEGWADRQWPWHRAASVGLVVLLASLALAWPGGDFAERYLRFLLAVGVGGGVMLVTERRIRTASVDVGTVLRVVFWSGAAMAATAFLVGLLAIGTFGEAAIADANELPLVSDVTKQAYLEEGFVAVTNWHEDPGYAAAWSNLWLALALTASVLGHGSGRRWLDALIIGGLGLATLLTYSRTGLFGLFMATLVAGAILVWRRHTTWRDMAVRLGSAGLATLALLAVLWVADRENTGSDIDEAVAFRIEQGFSLGPGEGTTTEGAIESFDYRGVVWPLYWDFFRDDPLLGAGLSYGWESQIQEPHNLALQLLGESGLVGLAGFLLLLVLIVRSGAGTPGVVALTVAFAAGLTQTILFEPTWWFGAGLFLGGATLRAPPRTAAERAGVRATP